MLGWARSRTNRGFSIGAALGAAVAALMLSGCSGSMIADHLPAAIGGLPEGVPERPPVEQVYPAVHNMPPPRATSVLNEAQQKKLEDDLVAVRNRTSPDAPSTTGTTDNSTAGAAKKP